MVNNHSDDYDASKIKVSISEKSFPLVILDRLSKEDLSKYTRGIGRDNLPNKSKIYIL